MPTQSKQLAALSFCAATVPCILLLPQAQWLWAGGATALVAVVICLASKRAMCKSRWLLWGVLAWNFVALGATADALCAAFPDGNVLIGALLLLLAAIAAGKGRAIVLRVGAVSLFILLILYGMLLGFSIPEMQYTEAVKTPAWRSLSAALTPMLCLFLRDEGENLPKSWLLGVIVLAVFAAAVTGTNSDFYTAMKSVSILGAMERLEPLVSIALTVGGFCLLGMICCVNEKVILQLLPQKKNPTALLNFFLGAVCIWLSRLLGGAVLAIGTAIFWGVIPCLPQFLENYKKLRKNQKNA